jgi:hypothetical protein
MSVLVLHVPGWTRWPNQAVQAPLSVMRPIAGSSAAALAGSLAISDSASWITELSKPERPRPG